MQVKISVQENWQKNVSFTTGFDTSIFTTVLKHMLKLKHHFGSKIKVSLKGISDT